ncbi:DNA recombination protein RmuC [Parapedobacter indicus]|uniref:DNA recombination protein RmuC n=1 Tax=Parapedobacter indicus TaxID=1477437 RepID=A0A1I3KI65_9SPHI|nr:DNA recombination protein RmuC [Parapedobacter indicus]PPL01828.1 DNA recombination protein RmuC [Parapedobacter indicus]SFI72127.1 DNA recombination protein RmuC [Parapedobacter indicus]
MELYLIVIAVVILVIAVILFIKRPQSTTNVLDAENIRRLARAEQQVENLTAEKERIAVLLREEQQRLLESERSLESTRAYYQSQQEKLREQKADIETIKQQFNTEFQVIANKILEEKTQKFTETNSKSLDQILNPLKEKIKTFEEKVEKTYQHEAAERNSLKGVVQQLMEQSLRIKDEANSLTRALRGDSKKQGNWGEVILERVLERSGLVKDREYRLQAALTDEEGRRLQPDAIIDLPDEKHLVVDSKVSLLAYERWVNAETDDEREGYAKQHIQSIENHVKSLSAKNYHDLYQIHSPDFVLLFMPIESAFSMSITSKADLFSDAWDRKVVIVSPSTLLATLRTIASMWKQERQTRNVLEIAKEAGALYDKFVGFLQDLEKVGEYLTRAVRAHEDATRKLSTGPGNVVTKVEKLKKLGARANKQIDNDLLDDEK